MAWDIRKLEAEYNKLDKVSENNLTYDEARAKGNLASMLNFHYNKTDYQPASYPYVIESTPPKDLDRLAKDVSETAFDLYPLSQTNGVKHTRCHHKSIDESSLNELAVRFLGKYDTSLLELFLRYQDENRIELKPYTHPEKRTVLGTCYFFNGGNSNFISSYFKGSLKNSEVLMHELAHADVGEYTKKVAGAEQQDSAFCETISFAVELIYSEYLKDSGHYREGLSILEKHLDSFAWMFDYAYPSLLSLNETKLKTPPVVQSLSRILAFKLYAEYLRSPEKYYESLSRLKYMIGKSSDYEIFKTFNLEDSREDIVYVFEKYYIDRATLKLSHRVS